MHFVNLKTILSSKNRLNLYRGCTHDCIYCDSLNNCCGMEHNFENIEAKKNSLSLLNSKLRGKRKKCMIHFGSMSDPYLPEEKELKYTRKALESVYKHKFGATLITKSDLVLRDLDLIKKINDTTKCVVQMTLTTYDDNLCKKIEKNVCPTGKRVEVFKKLHEQGVPTIVWLSPILPFINDTRENISGILNYCAEAKVSGVICFGAGLTLRAGNRDYFYKNLDKFFPGLKRKYINLYGNNYCVNSKRHHELMKIFYEICRKQNIICDNKIIFDYLDKYELKISNSDLSLFDLMEEK
ncbi:MAG: radical SAM protein [Candidatus Cloacimonadota bacterium]|nr:MAG: radical SAM protein [Candidatus Cloacimonadota bacterium]